MAAAAVAPNSLCAQTLPLSPRLRITDAQIHIWSGGKSTPAQRQQPVSKDQIVAEMAGAGVERAIVVPTTWDPRGNDTAIEAAKAYPQKLAVVGLLDFAAPDSKTTLDRWPHERPMSGLRLFLATKQGAEALDNRALDWLWSSAEKAQIPLMVHAGGHLAAMASVAERHPGLRLCIDSLGAAPRTVDAAAFAELPLLIAMSRLPHVMVKAEGVPALSSEPYPHKGLHEPIRRIYDAFGPRRLFWGSDLTRLKSTTFRQAVTLFTEELPWLSEPDKRLIMGEALSDWIGWPLPA